MIVLKGRNQTHRCYLSLHMKNFKNDVKIKRDSLGGGPVGTMKSREGIEVTMRKLFHMYVQC